MRCNVLVNLWRRGRDSNPRSRLPEIPVFEAGAFNHSAPSPRHFDLQIALTIVKAPWQRPIFPHLTVQYRQRYDVSLPCSG